MIESFDAAMDKFPVDEMLDLMIPVYQKYLTKVEADALVEFYSSAVGQSVLTKMPAISVEAMQRTQPMLVKYMTNTMDDLQGRLKKNIEKRAQESKAATEGK